MEEKEEKEAKGLGDVLKKMASLGLEGAALSEEILKNTIGESSLPKSFMNKVLDNVRSTKEDFTKTVRAELQKHLSKLEVDKVVDYLAKNYDIEVKSSISLKKKKK